MAFIKEALGFLRVVAAQESQANVSVTLYRGMKCMKACVRLVRQHIALSLSAQPLPCAAQVQDNFLQHGRGGTELAAMSTTAKRRAPR